MTLFVDNPGHTRCCVFDFQTGVDHKIIQADPSVGTPVYRLNGLLQAILGSAFSSHTRIALYPYGSQPSGKIRAQAKDALVAYIRRHQPERVYIFKTIDKAHRFKGDTSAGNGTNSWTAFNPPGNMADCMFSRFKWGKTEIVAMPSCITHTDERIKYIMQQTAKSQATIVPKFCNYNPEVATLEALNAMRESLWLAVDIETIPSRGIITAIAIANQYSTVSIPWDGWQPSNPSLSYEPSLADYGQLGEDIYTTVTELFATKNLAKVGHNFLFDLKHLRALGLKVNGRTYDTLAMHAICHPTLRHSLQLAVCSELPAPPWKTEFRAPFDDRDERKWYYEPQSLRRYNALDAFYTARLFDAMKERF
jgi:hypothetical protein